MVISPEVMKGIAIGMCCGIVLFSVLYGYMWARWMAPQTPEEQAAADNEQARILGEMHKEKHGRS